MLVFLDVVLEAFYISELVLAPIVGSLSDRMGSKPFLLSAPLVGSVAALCLVGATLFFPHPHASPFDTWLVVLLLLVLVGRLLEGAATALNAPASLGYLTEATANHIRGTDPFDIESLVHRMMRMDYARAGEIAMSALATVEIACWDIQGCMYSTPC